MFQFKQSEATADRRRIFFYAVDATDGYTAVTASITSGVVLIVKNGNTPGTSPVSPSFTHISNGLWYYEMTASHLDTQGVVSVTITGSNIRTVQLIGYVYSGDPMAAIPTFPTNFSSLAISGSGVVTANTTQWNGTNVTGMPMPTYTQPTGFLSASFPAGTIANTTNITAGTITTVSGNVNGSVNSVATAVTANTTQWGGVAVTGMPMPTYTQPTGFLAASFPTTVASPTNITAGTITTVSGNVNGSVGSVTGSVNSVTSAVTVGTINANAINAAAIATDAIDADAIANSAITIRLDTDVTPSEARLVTGTTASDVWNALTASYAVNNSFGQRVLRSTSAQSSCAVTGSNHIAADIHELQPAVITNADFSAGAIDANALSPDACAEIADALLNRNIATGSSTGRTVKDVMKLLRNRVTVSATTLTVYEADGTTVAWTAAVASDPTAEPIIGITP